MYHRSGDNYPVREGIGKLRAQRKFCSYALRCNILFVVTFSLVLCCIVTVILYFAL